MLCSVEGCGRESRSRGFCFRHYRNWKKYGVAVAPIEREVAAKPLCAVDGCGREVYAKTFCARHYLRNRVYGDPMPPGMSEREPLAERCGVEGCASKVVAKGYCNKHWLRIRKHGDPNIRLQYIPPIKPKVACAADGCEKDAKSSGYCMIHYSRFKRYGDPLAGRRFRSEPPRTCSEPGCDKPHYANGRCVAHHSRTKRGVSMEKPLRPLIALIGTRYMTPEGYVWLVVPAGTPNARPPTKNSVAWRMMEHRYVMQQHLGRPLFPDERVHHKNGVRSFNEIENLELWSMSHPAGQTPEDKLKHALEILARYGTPEESAKAIKTMSKKLKVVG